MSATPTGIKSEIGYDRSMRVPQALGLVCFVVLWGAVAANARTSATPLPASSQHAAKFQNTVTLRWVGASKWELYVENTNHNKFINVFEWAPPAGLTIRAITSSEGGTCKLSSSSIRCSGNIAPASCNTCEGGSMTVNFVAAGFESTFVPTDYGGYWIAYGWQPGNLNVTSTSSFADLPLCAKGQVSTKTKPCVKG
jgi:hypothetical protein